MTFMIRKIWDNKRRLVKRVFLCYYVFVKDALHKLKKDTFDCVNQMLSLMGCI